MLLRLDSIVFRPRQPIHRPRCPSASLQPVQIITHAPIAAIHTAAAIERIVIAALYSGSSTGRLRCSAVLLGCHVPQFSRLGLATTTALEYL